MKILFVGDIYGEPGREYFKENLKAIKDKYKPNLIIINGENLAHGKGITQKIYKEIMQLGVSVITMGNHTWGNKEIFDILENSKIIIPANYPDRPKNGYMTIKYNDKTITIINLLGRVFMHYTPLDCPFKVAKEIIEKTNSDYYLIDFHAEATSEKVALANYLDGINGAIVGTHTHVQTADERILPKGTLYITDVGMTGPLDGVIGVDSEIIVDRFVYGKPNASKTAIGKRQFNGVILDLEKQEIMRINIKE